MIIETACIARTLFRATPHRQKFALSLKLQLAQVLSAFERFSASRGFIPLAHLSFEFSLSSEYSSVSESTVAWDKNRSYGSSRLSIYLTSLFAITWSEEETWCINFERLARANYWTLLQARVDERAIIAENVSPKQAKLIVTWQIFIGCMTNSICSRCKCLRSLNYLDRMLTSNLFSTRSSYAISYCFF